MLRFKQRPRSGTSRQFFLLCLAMLVSYAVGQGLPGGTIEPTRPRPKEAHFTLRITLNRGAPDCGRVRDIILVNDIFQPTLKANVNDTIFIHLFNDLPASMPQTSSGLTIHFHGLSMWDNATWADGTSYVTQCPLAHGRNVTFSFLADDAPGTYFWHDHSTINRANGLQGAFILDMPVTDPPMLSPYTYDGEYIMFLTDWFDTEGNAMAMALNRPIDINKVTNDTGMFQGIGVPDALLINGKGNINDCSKTEVHVGVKRPYEPPVCNMTVFTVPPRAGSPGCTHESFLVQKNKDYLFRIINSGTMQFMTVCFEGHSIEIMMADGTPTEWLTVSNGCVDINSGQRYDVHLRASSKIVKSFWISVHSQYRAGAPSAYAVLRYSAASLRLIPQSPTPQGFVEPWTPLFQSYVGTHEGVLGYLDNYDYIDYWQLFVHRGLYTTDTLFYGTAPNKVVVLNMTQPVMQANGMMRWAMNNIAGSSNPPCEPIMNLIKKNPNWIAENTVQPDVAHQSEATANLLRVTTFNTTTNLSAPVYKNGDPPVLFPAAGLHMLEVGFNEVIDIVMNNLGGSALNGDYRNLSRRGSEQHPMHLHGHKFWVLGQGDGVYDYDKHYRYLNLHNPMLRDTATLAPDSWLYIRFLANNPGIWPFHCHIMWHSYMGQQLYIVEAADRIPDPPSASEMPECPSSCLSNFAPYTESWVKANVPDRWQKPEH